MFSSFRNGTFRHDARGCAGAHGRGLGGHSSVSVTQLRSIARMIVSHVGGSGCTKTQSLIAISSFHRRVVLYFGSVAIALKINDRHQQFDDHCNPFPPISVLSKCSVLLQTVSDSLAARSSAQNASPHRGFAAQQHEQFLLLSILAFVAWGASAIAITGSRVEVSSCPCRKTKRPSPLRPKISRSSTL